MRMRISFLVLLISTFVSCKNVNGQDGCYQRIFNFGDSLSDTGNLILESSSRPSFIFSHLPYGLNFPKGPTGRCSDGRLMIDFIAESLGLPLLNPYLSLEDSSSTQSLAGVNFAVVGATALEAEYLSKYHIGSLVTNSSLTVQLNWFKSYLSSICHCDEECSNYLDKALFMLGEIGGNDYNYAFLRNKTMDQVMAMVPDVVNKIKEVAEDLISLGAKVLVVPGNFPIGCLPLYLTTFKVADNPFSYDTRGCLEEFNAFPSYHNDKLVSTLDLLRLQHPDLTILYADYYNALNWVIDNAPVLGFKSDSVLKSCCGSGGEYRFNLKRRCGSKGVSVCADPSLFISWDGIHMTEQAYKHMAAWLLQKLQLENRFN